MTKKEFFNDIINLATENNRQDIADFAMKEIALIEKRASNDSKAKKKKVEEKAKMAAEVLAIITEVPATTQDIAAAVGISTQKATPLLKVLVEMGKVQVEKVKGRNMYSLAA